ncbi:MAG: hypothetical protein K2W95_30845 [Candidatus Obscuribacterales bacterium]|nr:hypothetical protein [Candidatus Obscuribacterales bacterium]
MSDNETALSDGRRVFWPSPQDYNEAIQHPSASLSDLSLHNAEAEVDSLGIPRPVSGGFASVYKLSAGNRDWAIRFFLLNIADQQDRYSRIAEFIGNTKVPYMVNFEYQPQGVRIAAAWFPLLKMEWVDGLTLEQYVVKHATDRARMDDLCARFLQLESDLRASGIAHGDLQHGNIIVMPGGELRLVDYDGLYIPSMPQSPSSEKGHPNYQHPDRDTNTFDESLDNFSSLVIYTSLLAIAKSPHLLRDLNACSENLLFRAADFAAPEEARVFHELERHTDDEIRHLAKLIRTYVRETPEAIPSLQHLPETLPRDLPELSSYVEPFRTAANQAESPPPDWWKGSAAGTPMTIAKSHSVVTYSPSNFGYARTPKVRDQLLSLQMNSTRRSIGYNWNLHQICPHLTQLTIAGSLVFVWFFIVAVLLQTGTAFLAPLGLLLIPTAIAYGASVRLWKDPLRHRRLASKGTAAIGTILEICQISQENGLPRFMIYYSYRWNNQTYNHHMLVNQGDQRGLTAGAEATVLIDEADPGNSVLYDLSTYKAKT